MPSGRKPTFTIPPRLKKCMEKSNIDDLYVLAESIGVHKSTLSRNLSGTQSMSLSVAIALLKVLGFKFSECEALLLLEEIEQQGIKDRSKGKVRSQPKISKLKRKSS